LLLSRELSVPEHIEEGPSRVPSSSDDKQRPTRQFGKIKLSRDAIVVSHFSDQVIGFE
jgi:hypothetical protein